MHRILCFITLALLMGFSIAIGTECKVEDWRYRHVPVLKTVWIEGGTTCDKGEIRIRAYDTSEGTPKFIGVDDAFIEGHIFKARVRDVPKNPKSMEIKYAIEPQ